MSNPATVTASEASVALSQALSTLTRSQGFDAMAEESDLQLAVEIGELNRLETVMSAVMRDMKRRKDALERRQKAIEESRTPTVRYRY